MSKEAIKKVLKRLPELTNVGVGLPLGRKLSDDEYKQQFTKEQKALINNTEQFERACSWLRGRNKTEGMSRKYGDYTLKHIAEKDIGYTSTGAFIAAAIHCGFRFEPIPHSYGLYFNICVEGLST